MRGNGGPFPPQAYLVAPVEGGWDPRGVVGGSRGPVGKGGLWGRWGWGWGALLRGFLGWGVRTGCGGVGGDVGEGVFWVEVRRGRGGGGL